MKKRHTKILMIFLVILSYVAFIHCGSATSTPPVDIPTPVSHLSISSPDIDGVVYVTADAGFCDGATNVSVINTSAGTASLAPSWLIRSAYAQSTTSLISSADGSFQAHLEAAIGDSIKVGYIKNGSGTSVTTTVPANQPLLTLTATLQDVGIDPNTGNAMVVANDGADGFVYVLDPSNGQVQNTITLTGASGASRIATDPTTGDSLVVDGTNTTVWNVDLSALSAVSTVVLLPFDAAFLESGQYVIITHTNSTVVSYFNTATNLPEDSATATGGDGAPAEMATYVDTDNDGTNDVFAIVAWMADNTFHVVRYRVSGGALTQISDTELGASVTSVGGLALFNSGTEALVTDSDNDQVLRVDLVNDSIAAITVGDNPCGVAVNDQDNQAYVVNSTARNVSIINLNNDSTSYASDAVGLSPAEVGLDRSQADADVVEVNSGDGTVNLF